MATKKAALGRGLSALLPSANQEATPPEEVTGVETPKSRLYHFEERLRLLGRVAEIDIDRIRPNPYQPRKDFDEEALDELARSIAQLGIIQPITVRALGNNEFEVISGERRLRAARRAGLKRVPAYVREADTEEMLEMALVENVQREELNPIEVALGYQRLIEECGLTQEQVAEKVGKNRATVANFLRLLKLPPRIQASLRDGTITAGHARALIGLPEAVQLRLLQEIETKQLSVREVEERVRAWHRRQERKTAGEAATASAEPDPETLQIRDYEDQLRRRLGTQVRIRHRSGRGGRIEIAYFSDEELERLLSLLLGA
ncbi:ParB/RepB/Spo0J family partition protein [Rhodothermus marinus]|uniref:ParB/RepB/Spo0J family partition protein n=1 Tax=Rhodothermus marinus TaxID=29549 RepID=UPI0037CAF1B8